MNGRNRQYLRPFPVSRSILQHYLTERIFTLFERRKYEEKKLICPFTFIRGIKSYIGANDLMPLDTRMLTKERNQGFGHPVRILLASRLFPASSSSPPTPMVLKIHHSCCLLSGRTIFNPPTNTSVQVQMTAEPRRWWPFVTLVAFFTTAHLSPVSINTSFLVFHILGRILFRI